MGEKEAINTYLLIQFDNERLASEAHKRLVNELEIDPWEASRVNECCLIVLSPDSDLTLDELAGKIFKLPGVGTFDLHIARAGLKGDKEFFEAVGHFTNTDFRK